MQLVIAFNVQQCSLTLERTQICPTSASLRRYWVNRLFGFSRRLFRVPVNCAQAITGWHCDDIYASILIKIKITQFAFDNRRKSSLRKWRISPRERERERVTIRALILFLKSENTLCGEIRGFQRTVYCRLCSAFSLRVIVRWGRTRVA